MKHNLLIDLDVLFDTRLGVVNAFNSELGEKLVESAWRHRLADDPSTFIDMSKTQFDELYRNRNKRALQCTTLTNFIIELGDMISDLQNMIAIDAGRIKESCILLNLYPYTDLTEAEVEGFVIGLHAYIGHEIPIKPVFYKPEDLTMSMLKSEEILTYIVYDFSLWINSIYNLKLGKEHVVPYPQLTVVTPEILPSNNIMETFSGQEIRQMGTGGIFGLISKYFAPMFVLSYLPLFVMSIIDTKVLRD